ncbi:MAG: substrate-binding domain-containing protein, partial [Clostridiales bacterium]|jgi:DNA-binding LacI/PurR family transcriptional regulator|nr:substrate-binding domain-containing protein [Clostridiales bacterium]
LEAEAIILQPAHAERFNEEVLKISLERYPVVLVDRDISGLSLSFAGSDNVYGTRNAINYLFARGHRDVCFISSEPKNTTTIEERMNAFNSAFIENNTLNRGSNFFTKIQSTRMNFSKEAMERDIGNLIGHLTENPGITCVFAAEYAVGVLIKEAVKRMGKRIPDDISLVTYDNVVGNFFLTNTAYIRQNEEEIGKKAVQLAIDAIQEKPMAKIYLPTEFIVNNSIKDLIKNRL